MFNVLPDNLKAKIKAEYKIRFIALVLVAIVFLQVIFLVFLFPSWIISIYNEQGAITQMERIKESPLAKGASPIAAVITDTNKKLLFINSLLEYSEVAPSIKNILDNKTPAVRINEFSYTFRTATSSVFLIGGISATRDGLVSFVKNLEKSGIFKNVYLPVSDLAKDKDIEFHVTLSVEKK